MKYYLWFDPGKKWAYAILDSDKNIIETGVIPTIWNTKPTYDMQWLKEIFNRYEYEMITIEKIWVIFGIGKTSMLSLWHWMWLLEWMANMTWSRILMVPPKTWQKEMWKHITIKKKVSVKTDSDWNRKTRNTNDTKATSEYAAITYYPNYDFRKTNRSKKRHDWIIDATLICRYWIINN